MPTTSTIPPSVGGPYVDDGYFLSSMGAGFETGAGNMMAALNQAEVALQGDPSSPSTLANYQTKLEEYTLFRNAQTSAVKAFKDIGSSIIQNFR